MPSSVDGAYGPANVDATSGTSFDFISVVGGILYRDMHVPDFVRRESVALFVYLAMFWVEVYLFRHTVQFT